jgi:hypothetical protein
VRARFRFFLDEQQFQPRETLADARHDVRQQIRAERREDAQAQRAGFRIDRAPRDRLDLVDLAQHAARALRDLAADFGEQHLARRALDEGDAELVFELLDLRRQRRLADETRLGGVAEVLVLGEGDEVTQIAQVHMGIGAGYRTQFNDRRTR